MPLRTGPAPRLGDLTISKSENNTEMTKAVYRQPGWKRNQLSFSGYDIIFG
jgi:hypothetical protein